MSKVNLLRKELISFGKVLSEIKEPEGEQFTVQFKHAISRTKYYLKDEIGSIYEDLNGKAKIIKEKKESLDKELCRIKDGCDPEKDGVRAFTPRMEAEESIFIVVFGLIYLVMYETEDDKEYAQRFEQIIKEEEKTCKEIDEWMDEKVTIEVHSVQCDKVWSGLSQDVHDRIVYMID